jgi:hypothetical protein
VETTQEYYLDKGKAGARMNSPDAEETKQKTDLKVRLLYWFVIGCI